MWGSLAPASKERFTRFPRFTPMVHYQVRGPAKAPTRRSRQLHSTFTGSSRHRGVLSRPAGADLVPGHDGVALDI